MKRFLSLLLIAAMLMTTVAFAAPIKSSYNLSSNFLIDGVGWYTTSDVSLILRDETTYELFYREYMFGTTDPGLKASKLIVYSGTYSSVDSADGEYCHLDITLNTNDSIYFEQHGKGYGRTTLGYPMVLDTLHWEDYMTDIAFPYGNDTPAEAFVSHYSIAGTTLTVEDLRLDIEDVTLYNRIVSLPEGVNFAISAAIEE